MAINQTFDHGPDPVLPCPLPLQACSQLTTIVLKTRRSQLGVDFQPCELSVICGQGKHNYNHEGNSCLRILASAYVESYSQADSKSIKSALVFNIVTMIRQAGGKFCRCEKGAWFEVGDRFACEKVSALFRDMLHTRYKSSAKHKTTRRRARKRDETSVKDTTARCRAQKQDETYTLQDDQQPDDCTDVHSEDDSSISSLCWESTLDCQGVDSLTEDVFFDIDHVF